MLRIAKDKLKEALSSDKERILKTFKNPEKETARRIAEDKLKELLAGDRARIIQIFKNPEMEFPILDGVEYTVTMNACYDYGDKERKKIRVEVAVEHGGRWELPKYEYINADDLRALEGNKPPTS